MRRQAGQAMIWRSACAEFISSCPGHRGAAVRLSASTRFHRGVVCAETARYNDPRPLTRQQRLNKGD
jgi:hypothetical protein